MSTDRNPPAADRKNFHEKLQRLRLKIDSLPQTQRPHLIALAETIDREHRRLHQRTTLHHDAD